MNAKIQSRITHLGALLSLSLLAACSPDQPAAQAQAQTPPEPAQQQAQPAAAGVTVFEGARLIVGDASAPIENGVLVIEDGLIAAAGPAGQVEVPAGATTVDVTGATIMPAIIDTHVHLNRERDALVEDLRARARFGVGAAVSMGQDEGEAVFQVQQEVIPGAARYLTAGRGFSAPEPGRSEIPHWVTDAEEARAAVREEAGLGVDIIKIWVDDRNGQYDKLAPDVYRAIIDEAHMHDLQVTAHIFNLADAKDLLDAGVDHFAHGVRDVDVDEEFLQMVSERPNLVLGANLPDPGTARDVSWLQGQIPDDTFQQLQEAAANANAEPSEAFSLQARNLVAMHEVGVTVALGTDGNTPWGPHLEMEDMVRAGLSPADVITAATANGATALGLAGMGTLEAGKSADFIVLDANPLDDITNTRMIRDVYLRGERVER